MSRERWVAVVPVQLDALGAVHGWSRTVRHLARRTVLDATWEPDETGAHVVTDFRDVESWAQHLGARRRTVADGLTVLAAAGWDYEPAAGHRPGRLAVPGELYRQLVQAPGDRRVDWSVWLRPDELDALADTQGWTFARRGRLEDVLCVADETGQLAATRTALAGMIRTDPSTLTPDLAAWTKAGITATEGRRVTMPGWSRLVRPAPDHVIAARRLARQTGKIVRENRENRPRETGKSSASPAVSPPSTGGTGVTENPSPSVTAKAERAAEREGQGVGAGNEVKDLAKETAKATGDTQGGMTTMPGAPGPWWADWADAVPACWRATLVGQLTAADQAGGVRALRRARAALEARLGVDAARQAIAEDWPHPVDSPIGFLLQRARRRIAEHDERQGYADDDAAERAAEARRAAAGRARSTAAHVHLLLAQGETPAGIVECYRHAPTDTRETVTQTLTWLGFDPTAPVVPAIGADGPVWDGHQATVEDYARARHAAGVAHQTILTEIARASQDPLWLTVRAAAAVLEALGQTAPAAEAAPEPAPAAGGLAQARAELARSLGLAGRPPEAAGGPQEDRSGPGGSAGPSGAPLASCGGSGGRRAPGSTREDRR